MANDYILVTLCVQGHWLASIPAQLQSVVTSCVVHKIINGPGHVAMHPTTTPDVAVVKARLLIADGLNHDSS